MNCPICDDVRMKEVQKGNVLIDICPSCKGVWLDRGELEKITAGLKDDRKYYEETVNSYDRHYENRPDHRPNDYQKGYDSKNGHYGYKKKKKKTMFDVFEDLF